MARTRSNRAHENAHFPVFDVDTQHGAPVPYATSETLPPLKALVKRLCETFGPTGSEEEVRELVRDQIKSYVDEIRVDALGNLIAHRRGNGSARKKIMLAAHLDEIGIIVTFKDALGFYRFGALGGVKPLTLLGQRCQFANGRVGVFGREERDASREEIVMEKMFIDVGGDSNGTGPVEVGDSAAFYREFVDAGEYLIAKALDDRIGCAILIQLARQLKKSPHDLYFVFTAQEEVGVRGAVTAAFAVQPEFAVAVDVTHTGDTPGALASALALGKGPAIKVKDASLVASPQVRNALVAAARESHVPYQMEVMPRLSTDGTAIQASRAGVPTGVLSIPMRYMHTPSEMVHYGDVQDSIQLLLTLLSKPF